MKFFWLNEEVYFIPGSISSLYNLFTGEVYIIDKFDAEVLIKAEQGYDISNYENYDIFKKLILKKMGKFYRSSVFIEKINLLPEWLNFIYFKPAPKINSVTISLSKCKNNCLNCDGNIYRRFSPCFCNSKEVNDIDFLKNKDILELLVKLKKLGSQELIFLGSSSEDIDKELIIKNALKLNFDSIKYIQCYKSLSDINYKELGKLGAILYIQINYDEIGDSFLRKILSFDRKKFVVLIQARYGLDKFDKVTEFFKKHKISYMTDYVFCNDTNKQEIFKLYNEINFKIDSQKFSVKRKYCSCLVGKFTILSNGDIVPCIGLKEFKVGNYINVNEIFTEKNLLKFWNLSSSKINKCRDCGLRYACNDCRSMEMKLGSTIDEKISCIRRLV